MRNREEIMNELTKGCANVASHLFQCLLDMEKASVDEKNDIYIAALGEQI